MDASIFLYSVRRRCFLCRYVITAAVFLQNFDHFAPNPNSQRFSVSIGLNNVNERLRLRYGTEAMLHIENASGGGACISFEIPVEE